MPSSRGSSPPRDQTHISYVSSLLFRLERGPGIALQAMQEKKALSSRSRSLLLPGCYYRDTNARS